MQVVDDVFRPFAHVFVKQSKEPETEQQYEGALYGFHEGDCAHARKVSLQGRLMLVLQVRVGVLLVLHALLSKFGAAQ
jgi:hypothetical protein